MAVGEEEKRREKKSIHYLAANYLATAISILQIAM